MPLRLEIKRKLSARSERVKSVDFHPAEPWILAALFSGHLFLWNYQTQTLVKSVEVCEMPLRCAKFIARKQWIVCASDDLKIRIFNYNTMEKIKEFDAHIDYIRCLAVHPTLPYVLSCSDDMFIKLWDWDKGWENTMTFEGHSHYVMQVEFNPKDSNTFASASLDRTIKFWGLNANTPHFSLEGHERGVNCLSFFRGGERPYIVSGADDQMLKVWDYGTKACVSTLEGHTNNVAAVVFHPTLPVIISGSEDGTVKIWHANTYRLENTLNYAMERVWSIACLRGSNKVALGYDDGTVMIKLGQEEPVVSMEKGGKVVWADNQDLVQTDVKKLKGEESAAPQAITDGERITPSTKNMGTCELYPQTIEHSPNGRFFVACGDGEYIIYTALAQKGKSFGAALDFVWAPESGSYATRESPTKIKVFKSFQESRVFRPNFNAEAIFGGALLGVRGPDFIDFVDWNEQRVVRRIDVCPRKVYWSETGEVVVLTTDSSFYVLRYNKENVQKWFEQAVEIGEQGIDTAFELEQEVQEKVRTGLFVGECFIYTNGAGRLNYLVGGEVVTLAHLSKTLYLLGYRDNKVFLMDKQYQLFAYSLSLAVLLYQTAIVRRDFEAAEKALGSIPVEQHNKLARFLEAQGLHEMALNIATDPDHRFELAMHCNKLKEARAILLEAESESKWKQLGDAALREGFDLKLAETCFRNANDLPSLLLIYTSLGDTKGMEALGELSASAGAWNIAIICNLLLRRLDKCVDLLCLNNRIPEAAFFARTYCPSAISRVLVAWKENLRGVSARAADALADPNDHPDLSPDLPAALAVESWSSRLLGSFPARAHAPLQALHTANLIAKHRAGELDTMWAQLQAEIASSATESVEHPAEEDTLSLQLQLAESQRQKQLNPGTNVEESKQEEEQEQEQDGQEAQEVQEEPEEQEQDEGAGAAPADGDGGNDDPEGADEGDGDGAAEEAEEPEDE